MHAEAIPKPNELDAETQTTDDASADTAKDLVSVNLFPKQFHSSVSGSRDEHASLTLRRMKTTK